MSVSKKFKIADDSIDIGKLAASVTDMLLPLGTIIDWYPVNAPGLTAPNWNVPTGYALCDGRDWNDIDNNMGADGAKLTTGKIPNLVGRVTIGAQANLSLLASAGHTVSTGAQTNPGINGVAGSNTDRHEHTVPEHSHTITHTHTIDHNHGVHGHLLNTKSQQVSSVISNSYISGPWQLPLQDNGWYTQNSGNIELTGNTASGPMSQNGTVTKPAVQTGGNNYQDNRPLSVGVLKIMKVKLSA